MKKEITVGNLLTVLVLIMGWGITVNSRMSHHDAEIKHHQEVLKVQGAKIEKVDDKIDENFKLIVTKLDKIYKITFQNKHNNEEV